ncbi:MAG: hypothetical protein ACYTXA_00195 [Nostoc sp.]
MPVATTDSESSLVGNLPSGDARGLANAALMAVPHGGNPIAFSVSPTLGDAARREKTGLPHRNALAPLPNILFNPCFLRLSTT